MRRALEFIAIAGAGSIAGAIALKWWQKRSAGGDEDQLALPPTQNPATVSGGVSILPLTMPMMPQMPQFMPQMPPPPMVPFAEPRRNMFTEPTDRDSEPLTPREELALLRARQKARKTKDADDAAALLESEGYD